MELVVGASEATMKSLLSKLGSLLAQEYALIRGVRGEIQYINDELATMQAFLRDLAAASDHHGHQTRDWMKQVRDIAYDIEDCIDDFAHRLDDPRGDDCCSVIRRTLYELKTWWPRRDIGAKLADLKNRAQQVGERRTRYGVDNPTRVADGSDRASAAWFDAAEHQLISRQLVAMKEPVGMNTTMEELGKWVTNSEKNRGVLSIVGFGGVGKTTIATALYRKFGDQFDRRAMVTVSQRSDHEAALRDILGQVMPQAGDHEQQSVSEKKHLAAALKGMFSRVGGNRPPKDGGLEKKHVSIEEMTQNQLFEKLQDHLKDKSYLLFIDDVWSSSTWEKIRDNLPKNEKGSRIIVTTRFQAVAAACYREQEKDCPHTVDVLRDDGPKDLFQESVSESKGSKDIQVPGNIWQFCGGLPLAIVTMAGLVASNPHRTEKEWTEQFKALRPESVNFRTPEGVTRILNFCYNDLPADLKTCSLYLSIFPKSCKISRKRLTRRWIAEGFVSEKQGLSVEEVAEAYFSQLIRRKIIRPVEHSSNGKVKTCQVHDMVLEYIISKSSEENFITVVGGHWLMPMPSNKVRRLSFQSSDRRHKQGTESMNLTHVRSLTVFGSLDQLPFHSFKIGIVQVLDLEGCKGFKEHHVKQICKMILLKYLSLRRTDIDKIPQKIGNLQYLETLDVRDTNIEVLPKSIGQLEQMSNILGGSKRTRKALKLPEEIKNKPRRTLRILSGIEISEGSTAIADLHELTGLRKLTIYKLRVKEKDATFKDLRSSIEFLGSCSLQTLAIDDEFSDFVNSLDSMSSPPRYLNALELSGILHKPPQWIANLSSLNKLTLSVTVLRTDTFELLKDKLSSLFSFTFTLSAAAQASDIEKIESILEKNKSDTDGEIFVPGEGFESLKLLRFFAPRLPKLSFSEKAMPKLERLEMRFETFEGLFGTETLESLKEVHLRVNEKADDITKFIVDDLATAAREYAKWPRIIVDQYYD